MPNKEIAVLTANMNVEVVSVIINRINLKSDDSGEWNIGVDFKVQNPTRSIPASVSFQESHRASAQVKVSRQEVAAAAGISEDLVRTTLTLAQTENIVTQVAMSKLFPILGLSQA